MTESVQLKKNTGREGQGACRQDGLAVSDSDWNISLKHGFVLI
jgi:hypothetical protein